MQINEKASFERFVEVNNWQFHDQTNIEKAKPLALLSFEEIFISIAPRAG